MISGILGLSCQFTQSEHNILVRQQSVRNRTLVQRRESFLAVGEHSFCLFLTERLLPSHNTRDSEPINREQKTVSSANGLTVTYDKLVLATGSYPFVLPIKGYDTTGTFVYRTIEDLEAMSAYAKHSQIGVRTTKSQHLINRRKQWFKH